MTTTIGRERAFAGALLVAFVLSALMPLATVSAASSKSTSDTEVPSLAPGRDRVRFFYYRHSERALESFKKNYKSIDVIAPQSYTVDGAGNLQGTLEKEVSKFAKKKRIKVVPLVTNGAFNRQVAHLVLDSIKAQDNAIDSMIEEAKDRGFAGWQIDFEQMDDTYRDRFSAFIERAADAFHEEGLSLSVAVVSKISDDPEDYPNDLWRKLIGVFDFEALGESADFVSIMSYDDPYSKGPVAQYSWLEEVVEYALDKIPAEKLSLGVPLYYWEREDSTKRIMEIGGANGINYALTAKGAKKGYSKDERTAYVKYKVGDSARTLWYENTKSMEAKLDIAEDNEMHGFSAWALGLELPELHKVFKKWGK